MTAPAAPDIQRVRDEASERLDFARRVLGTDGALVAWRVAQPDAWLTGADPAEVRRQVAAFEAALAAGRAGFDYGQRFVYAAGGRGAMLVRLGQAGALCGAVDTAFREATEGRGVLAATYVPFDPDGSAEAEALALSKLRRELVVALDEADPADALPPAPKPLPGPRLVAAPAPSPVAHFEATCARLIDLAVGHASLAALVDWATAHAPDAARLGLGPDAAFVAPVRAGLDAPAKLTAALTQGIRDARWAVGLADAAAEAFAELRWDWGLVAARPPLAARRALAAARALAHRAQGEGAAQAHLGVMGSGATLTPRGPAASRLPADALSALADTLDRLADLAPAQRATLRRAAPARALPEHPAGSDLRATLAADAELRAWLGPEPFALPRPVTLALADLEEAR